MIEGAFPRVGVVIVNYNTGDLLRQCLHSLFGKSEGIDLTVCVVDNDSADQSIRLVEEGFPSVKVIRNRENRGFASANNVGIRATDGDYVFLLNPDTVLLNNAIKIFLEYMEKEENRPVACCGAALVDGRMAPQISYGNFPGPGEAVFAFLRLKKLFPSYYRKKIRISNEVEGSGIRRVDYVVGADMFLRRKALDEAGLMDEEFFLYFEDTELCFRLKSHGFASVILPEARIAHIAAGSSSAISKLERAALREKSRFLFFRKCYGTGTAFFIKSLYIAKELTRWLGGFRKGHLEMMKVLYRS